jgi:hypothetical protein
MFIDRKLDNMSRFEAFGIHFSMSFAIFLFLGYLVVFQWYPDFFFDADGGWRGLRIIVAVDLILGPTLTLIVFKAGKPGLKTDLLLIGLFQLACLLGGVYVVYSERPVAVVYADGRFTSTTMDDYADLTQPPDFDAFPGDYPKWIMVPVPQGLEAEADFRSALLGAGRGVATAVEYYQPFDPTHPQFIEQPIELSLIADREDGEEALDRWLSQYGGGVEDYNFYLFTTRYLYRYAGFRKSTGKMVGFVDIKPR